MLNSAFKRQVLVELLELGAAGLLGVAFLHLDEAIALGPERAVGRFHFALELLDLAGEAIV